MDSSTSDPAPYVFLSYASVDRERALRIADVLEGRGITVWIDRKSIAGGTIRLGVVDCALAEETDS